MPRSAGVSAIYPVPMSPSASIVLPSGSGGPPSHSVAGLHELSAPGMYSTSVTTGLVGSYSTFSPLPHAKRGGSFLLHRQTLADLFLLGSGMPYAARTFLSPSGLAPRGQRQTGLLSFFVV